MFFEGSEKKIEVIFRGDSPSLLDRPRAFWDDLVDKAQAKILSTVENSQMKGFLLSESSLFVTAHDLVLITCGTTQMINAAQFILENFEQSDIEAFFYERKNEVFPQAQRSNFFDDLDVLKKHFDGESFRFGREDEHHLFLFATQGPYTPPSDDHTMEILMHGVNPEFLDNFANCQGCDKEELRKRTSIASIVRGQVDDFVFEPMGYSLNAIENNKYFTIHITPEVVGNYTSFETNALSRDQQIPWARKVLDVFRPISFDLVLFNAEKAEQPKFEGYNLKRFYHQKIQTGYNTQYFSFYHPQSQELSPHKL